MQTCDMSFFARIADPLMAGTYMTLMNGNAFEKESKNIFKVFFIVIYIGSKIFKSLSIWMVDVLTWKSCVLKEPELQLFNSTELSALKSYDCNDELSLEQCNESGGNCEITVDGFYIEVALNFAFGVFWYFWAKTVVEKLQNLPLSEFHVLSNRNRTSELEEEALPLKQI
jgi:MFS transporter, PAT family, solute carrier family 33 (acetyl-CoA transportor), member 1